MRAEVKKLEWMRTEVQARGTLEKKKKSQGEVEEEKE
jgi:hypothetical protein